MDRARYDTLVRQQFDPTVTAKVLTTLLGAEAFAAIRPYFEQTEDWSDPLRLDHLRGPTSTASLIGAVACLLKNPNLCTRSGGQGSSDLEADAVAELAKLVFGSSADTGGQFTSGGTQSNLYGAKLGVAKRCPDAMGEGLRGERVVGLASEASHYSNRTIAGWLGLGMCNLLLVPTDRTFAMRLDALMEKLDALYRTKTQVAYVVATFGTTDAFGCDDIAAIHHVIDESAAKHGVPAPHLHVDAAVGWALAFLMGYNSERNPLEMIPEVLPTVRQAQRACAGLRFADSVTVDFHKLGFGHYPASTFLVRQRDDLRHLRRDGEDLPYFAEADERDPARFTLETSRPALGPYVVAASLSAIDRTGWQMLIGRSLELAHELKSRLDRLPHCKVLNADVPGASVAFWVLPKGTDAQAFFDQLERGELSHEQVERTFAAIRRQFVERSERVRDIRLGFTTNVGYRPHGYALPAWRAVFFNPRTDETAIDRLIESLER